MIEHGLSKSHVDTLETAHSVGRDWLRSIERPDALRYLNVLHRRLRRLADDLDRAISANPIPSSLQSIIAEIPSQTAPSITTLGELRRITGQPLDSKYEDHPLDCPDCSRLSRDSNNAGSIIFSLSCPPCLAAIQSQRLLSSTRSS